MSALLMLLTGLGLFAVTRPLGVIRQTRTADTQSFAVTAWLETPIDVLNNRRHALVRKLRASLAALDVGKQNRPASSAATSLLWLGLYMILLITLIAPA